jgi:cyclopropane fatty-acyl-phospholipid synthase-like methyltransferase
VWAVSLQSVITADVVDFDTKQHFDRVVSIEMFEHMKNYQALLRKVAGWLKPGGLLFVHIFTHRSLAYHFEVRAHLICSERHTEPCARRAFAHPAVCCGP